MVFLQHRIIMKRIHFQRNSQSKYLPQNKFLPTPKARDYRGSESKRVIETSSGYSKVRKNTKVRYGASLNDVVEYLHKK